jgi:four helix bundle protein
MKDFKGLKVWQKAHELAVAIYSTSRAFPREEMYVLTGQLRRAAVSIGANIAEGCGRRSDGVFVRFLQIAPSSSSEVDIIFSFAVTSSSCPRVGSRLYRGNCQRCSVC